MSTITIKSLLRAGILGLLTLGMPALCGGVLTHRESVLRQIPDWVILPEKQETVRLTAEQGREHVTVRLTEGTLHLETDAAAYVSDSTWLVADCMIRDIDHDGFDEVLLHVWKPGSFGDYQPFWMEEDDKTVYSEHLFIYEWDMQREDRLDPKWMSSAMPVGGEHVSIEEGGVIRIISPDQSETRWVWEGWGLVRVD